jgi:hypothetical protein
VFAGPTPEAKLRKALLASLASIEYALRLDSAAEVLEESEVRQIHDFEREQTAHVLGELRRLERRWPAIGRSTRTACRAVLERVPLVASGSHVPETTEWASSQPRSWRP